MSHQAEASVEQRSPWATARLPTQSRDASPAPRIAAPMPRGDLIARVGTSPDHQDTWTWVSTHGGAGSTSLVHGAARGLDLTGRWPAPEHGWPARVVLVARSNMAGLAAAGRFLQEWAAHQVPDLLLVGLVIVADAPGRPTRAARNRSSELAAITTVWQLPWVARWRDTPYTAEPAAQKVAATVAATLTKENPT